VSTNSERRQPWVDLLALVLSFLASIVTLWGAISTYVSQAQIPETSLWPLPGLVLVDWLHVGVSGFIAAFFSLRRRTVWWHRMTWLLTGAFIPLFILGALSIGPLVLIAFFLALISTFIITIRLRWKWLESIGYLLLGSIINLAILALTIIGAGPGLL
jgi:hypothetical protein